MARGAAYIVRDLVRSNIRRAVSGTGVPYPLTTFPDDVPPRVPFLNVVNDWDVYEEDGRYVVRPTFWWWPVHLRGMTILAKQRAMRIQYGERVFFARKVVIPQRNPVPPKQLVQEVIERAIETRTADEDF